jgi:hypothetical protein
MKKINSLKIGAIHYTVKYVHDLHRADQKLDGHIQHGQAKISLDADLNHQAMVQTLLHETVHAVLTQMGSRLAAQEGFVDALAFGIYQLMRDNPALAREMLK